MVKDRKLIILALVIALALISSAWFLTPRNCFPSDEAITMLYVTGYDDKGAPFLLTEDTTDIPALTAALPRLQRRAISFPLRGYPLKEVAYEINGICADVPFCIVLREDETGFIYHLDSICYHLVNAKEWITLLNDLTSK